MKFIRFTRTKRGIITLVFLLLISILGFSYASFIFSTGTYKASELLIGKLNYGIEITNDSNNTSTISGNTITIPKGTTEYFTVTISSVNPVNSKYTLAYKTASNVTVKYTDRTPWTSSGFIKGYDENTYSKKIRIVVDNSSNTSSSTISLAVFGGYSFNSVASISLGEGYVSVTGPYSEENTLLSNRLVDIVEDDTDCITSTSTTCLYGGESLKNYVQYPTNDDKTENIWRIIGSYNINGDIVAKLISTKSSSTTTSTLTTDLSSFYNTLDKSDLYVYQTNYFNCNSASCSTSDFTNIGLLTTYEYNKVGGYNSYLSTLVPFLINDSGTIKEVNENDINTTTSTSSLRPTIYLKSDVQVSGSGTVDDPYTLSPAGDINIMAYTLNGESTSLTYSQLLASYAVKDVTCTNGTTATWDNTDSSVKLKSINAPDYCTINFGPGYTVTLSATNGTVTAPTSKTTGYNQSVSFTVTPNDGYKLELSTNTCGGTLSGSTYTVSNVTIAKTCSITFKQDGTPLYDKILADNPTKSTRSSFNSTFTSNTTGTIYTATEANVHNTTATTVYYYAGNTTNNWVKFANFYWRIIRTNADGSVRMLYHGTSTDSTSAHIGTSVFNTANLSDNSYPMYVGYMYGTNGTLASARNNTNNSTIKSKIDKWYKSNLLSYADYFSTKAVYCNDRGNAPSTLTNTTSTFYYAAYNRVYSSYSPTYNCTEAADAFSGENSSAKLTYPIALMTADEIMYAGGKGGTTLSSPYAWYYLNSANGSSTGTSYWWLLSPYYWYYNSSSSRGASVFYVRGSSDPGYLAYVYVNLTHAVRPSVSVKSTTMISGGTGTAEDPYIVITD